jgi:3-(3-hydroxy-phenyl)propionate hydroxylase
VDEIMLTPQGGKGELVDGEGLVARRYGLAPGGAVLFRPDGHVAARWTRPEAGGVAEAVERLWGRRPGRNA